MTQLYLPGTTVDHSMRSSLQEMFTNVHNWMSLKFLQLYSNKTEILVIGAQIWVGDVTSKLYNILRKLYYFILILYF